MKYVELNKKKTPWPLVRKRTILSYLRNHIFNVSFLFTYRAE
jgi:hypothetical protein